MITKADPDVRRLIADEFGADVMRGLDKLGVIAISASYYSRLIEQITLHKDYLEIIHDLKEGRETIFQCEMEHALGRALGPTHPVRSDVAPGDRPTPPQSSNYGQASGRSRKTSTPKADPSPAQS